MADQETADTNVATEEQDYQYNVTVEDLGPATKKISVEIPEYNAICPKTGLPDFGHLTIRYVPDRLCLELKSLKLYIVAYRNVGIFYENAVNRILADCVAACRPKTMSVTGTFSSRGGISSTVEARWPSPPLLRGSAP